MSAVRDESGGASLGDIRGSMRVTPVSKTPPIRWSSLWRFPLLYETVTRVLETVPAYRTAISTGARAVARYTAARDTTKRRPVAENAGG